jgi:hypothetical protein
MKSRNVVTGSRDGEPSPAAIIGGILALGVVTAIARSQREREQAIPFELRRLGAIDVQTTRGNDETHAKT